MSLVLLGAPAGESDTSTDIRVRRIPGRAASLVRFPIAVAADLAADAPVNVDGWAAQVHHVSALVRYVTALVPGDLQSWPRQPNVLRVALGEGVEPEDAGTYPTLDISALTLTLTINGVSFEGKIADAIHTNKVAPIGVGHRSQSGPDLLKREHFLVRFKRAGVVGAGTETTDYVACADVHVTRRVDMDMAVFEVQFQNGAWRSTNNPFQGNPTSSGPLYFDSLRIARSTLPSGYSAEHHAEHPFCSVTETNIWLIEPMSNVAEIHFMPPGGQCSARFGIWNPATVSVGDARAVLRGWDRGFPVSGPLSYHHVHAYGSRRELMLDIQAFRRGTEGEEIQWREPTQQGLDTWVRQESLASSAASKLRSSWLAGAADSRFQFLTTRRGWHHGWALEANASASGAAIYGHSVGHQACGAFELNTIILDGLITRMGLSTIDFVDGRAMHGDALAANNSSAWEDMAGGHPGVVGRLPYLWSNSDRKIAWLHPHQISADALVVDWGSQNPTQFRLAPSNRPWNAPYASKTCPYAAQINWIALSSEDGWSPFDCAHLSRACTPVEQGIWMWDDPIAHRLAEQTANSYAMMSWTQHDHAGHLANAWLLNTAPMSHIRLNNQAAPNAGYWRMAGYSTRFGQNIRNLAWPILFAVTWWEVAPATEKARLHPPNGSGNSWFRAAARFAASIFMLNGQCTRIDNSVEFSGANPHPFNAAHYGPTDLLNRTGRYPQDGARYYSCSVSFQGSFCAGALFAMKHGPLAGDPLQNENDHTVQAARNLARYARANYPTQPVKRPTKFAITSVGAAGLNDAPIEQSDIEAGQAKWYLHYLPQNASHDLFNFQAWPAQFGYRDTGELSMLDVEAYELGTSTADMIGFFNAIEAAFNGQWSGGFLDFPYGEHDWWIGVVAELIHRREQRTT